MKANDQLRFLFACLLLLFSITVDAMSEHEDSANNDTLTTTHNRLSKRSTIKRTSIKRSAGNKDPLVINVLVCNDYGRSQFLGDKSEETTQKLFNQMADKYQQTDFGRPLQLQLAGIVNLPKPQLQATAQQNVEAGPLLGDFSAWLKKQNALPQYDAALLLTDRDIFMDKRATITGLGHLGSLCAGNPTAIIEAREKSIEAAIVQTMAHELGHVFGMPHDGDGSASSCAKGSAIMSPRSCSNCPGTAKLMFSSCSVSIARQFLDTVGASRCSKSQQPQRVKLNNSTTKVLGTQSNNRSISGGLTVSNDLLQLDETAGDCPSNPGGVAAAVILSLMSVSILALVVLYLRRDEAGRQQWRQKFTRFIPTRGATRAETQQQKIMQQVQKPPLPPRVNNLLIDTGAVVVLEESQLTKQLPEIPSAMSPAFSVILADLLEQKVSPVQPLSASSVTTFGGLEELAVLPVPPPSPL